MNEVERETQAVNGLPSATNGAAGHAGAEPLALPSAGGPPALAGDDERSALVPTASRFGPAGAFAKRVIERLIRFYTWRQEAVNAGLTARVSRLESELGDVAGVRRDLTAAALDFGAIADRMRSYENVRRIVERSASFRSEVRTHRRELAELRAHFAALSARLTLMQRESAPVRASVDVVRGEVEALRAEFARLAERAGGAEASIGETSARLAGLARAGDQRETALAEAERRITELRSALDDVRTAAAREVAELEQRLAARADLLTGLVENGSRENGVVLEALRAGLEDRIERAQRTAATLRTAVDVVQREVAAAQERSAAAAEAGRASLASVGAQVEADRDRLDALQLRLGDVAGALNATRDSLVAESSDAALRLQEAVAELRSELAPSSAPDIAAAGQRIDRLAAELAALRARLEATPYMSAPIEAWPAQRISTADDFDYVGFEDVFRGPEAFIRERLRAYVPLIAGHAPVVELGSGRGEFLEIMRENQIPATGVDLDAHAVARARAKGLDNLVAADANAYLAGLEASSVGAVFSTQFAEHLPFAELLRCLELARTRLVPGGVFIAETVNPNSIEAWKTFYVDPSHQKPLFPEVFLFLCRSMGFADVRIFYPNGGGFAEAKPTDQHEYAVVARAPSPGGSRTAAPRSLPSGPRRRRKARPPE